MKTLSRWIIALAVVVLCSIEVGCTGAPQSIRLDPDFTEQEVSVITDARDQWCEKTGWCPTLDARGDAEIIIEAAGPVARGQAYTAGHTHGWTTAISAHLLAADPDMLWLTAAHELGHLNLVEHHGADEGCTMFWQHRTPAFDLTCE
jgi:hypothetical protein